MGQSTNAVLFYGFCWTEETSTPWTIGKDDYDDDDDEDWEERYARLKGLVEPTVKFPERRAKDGYSTPKDSEYTPEELAAKNEHSAFWSAKHDLVAASVVEIDRHCHGDCPMPYVCIRKSQVTNYRGDMTVITPDTLKVGDDWDAQLAAFCDLMGIDIKDMKPAWFMVSYWG